MARKAKPVDADPETVAEREAIETESTTFEKYTPPPILGFGPPPGAEIVYVGGPDNPEENYRWYKLIGHGAAAKRVPIYDNSLIGYLTNIRVVPKKWKNEWGYKVYIEISADRRYILRSGVDSEFSKRVVNGLLRFPDLSRPICITVEAGENKKVIFGHVSDGTTGEGIYIKNEDIPERLSPVIFEIQKRLGVEVQSGPSIKQTIADLEAKEAEIRR